MDFLDDKNKQRIVQELVPGKQITLAHIIASPDKILYEKLGLNPAIDYARAGNRHYDGVPGRKPRLLWRMWQ